MIGALLEWDPEVPAWAVRVDLLVVVQVATVRIWRKPAAAAARAVADLREADLLVAAALPAAVVLRAADPAVAGLPVDSAAALADLPADAVARTGKAVPTLWLSATDAETRAACT